MLDELVESGVAHIRQVNIPNAPAACGIHLLAVGLDHIQLPQCVLVANWLHHHVARATGRGLGIYGERHHLISGIDQQLIRRLRGTQRPPVDGDQVIALLNVDARFSQRRARVRIPILAAEDLLDPVNAACGIDLVGRAQQSNIHWTQIGHVAAANISMRVRKLANHLSHNVGQRIAIGDVWQQLTILFLGLLPVHSIHRRLKEVISLLPPHLIENFFPFRGRIDLEAHAG